MMQFLSRLQNWTSFVSNQPQCVLCIWGRHVMAFSPIFPIGDKLPPMRIGGNSTCNVLACGEMPCGVVQEVLWDYELSVLFAIVILVLSYD